MHSYHHHTQRRIFFWTLVIIYIASITFIIPYAFGYRFSLERGVFIYAGSLTVKSNPRTVTITIDGRTDTNPNFINNTYHISGIAPGEHTVRITRDGFQDFKKSITISSGISTELWNVILPRTSYERTPLAQVRTPYFYHAPHAAMIVLPFVQKDALAMTLINTDTENAPQIKTQILYRVRDTSFVPNTKRNVEWSRTAKFFTVPVLSAQERSDAFIFTADGTLIISLRDLFPQASVIDDVRWDPKKNRTLYAQIDNVLTTITLPRPEDTSADITTRIVANDVRTYTIANDTVYYLTHRTGVVHKITDNGVPRQITTIPTKLPNNTQLLLTVYDDTRLTLRDEKSGALEVFDATISDDARIIARNIRGTHFSDDGKKLLYWNDREISVFFMRPWNVQPIRNAGETLTIARFTTPVRNVQWAHDYEHVIYTVNHALKITSLDGRGGYITNTLLHLNSAQSVIRTDHGKRRIYITDTTGNDFQIFFIHFPEKDSIL